MSPLIGVIILSSPEVFFSVKITLRVKVSRLYCTLLSQYVFAVSCLSLSQFFVLCVKTICDVVRLQRRVYPYSTDVLYVIVYYISCGVNYNRRRRSIIRCVFLFHRFDTVIWDGLFGRFKSFTCYSETESVASIFC